MRFSLVRSVSLVGGIVLSGCGTLLAAPDGSIPEDDRSSTEPEPSTAEQMPRTPPADLASSQVVVDVDGGVDADANGRRTNGEDCTSNAECESGACFAEGKKHYCSIACAEPDETDATCEALGAPFSGLCSKQGFCKR